MAKQPEVERYLRSYTWPQLRGVNGIQMQNARAFPYYEWAYQQVPELHRLLQLSFQQGYRNPSHRPTAYQWIQHLERQLESTKKKKPLPPPPLPVASFCATPTTGTAPLTVTFADTSKGSITDWQWSFGDGGTSTTPQPTHTYATAGTYTVSLTVTGPGGANTATKTGYIVVTPQPMQPHNVWAWVALGLALLALVPALHLWTGLAAVGCGIMGWRRAQRAGGRGKRLAGGAVVLGSVMVLFVLLPAGLSWIAERQEQW